MPGNCGSRGCSAPAAISTASCLSISSDGAILRCRASHRPRRVVVEGYTLGLHLLDAALDVELFHLEVGNAVAHQAAGIGLALIDMHIVADTGELLGSCHARGA
jgi:hypothetical protein